MLKALEQGWFLRHGYPLVLLSDRGEKCPKFQAALRCLLEERNIGEAGWPSLAQEVTFACISYVNSSMGYSHVKLCTRVLYGPGRTLFPWYQTTVLGIFKVTANM